MDSFGERYFNSNLVRLKVDIRYAALEIFSLFQFQSGTIKGAKAAIWKE